MSISFVNFFCQFLLEIFLNVNFNYTATLSFIVNTAPEFCNKFTSLLTAMVDSLVTRGNDENKRDQVNKEIIEVG